MKRLKNWLVEAKIRWTLEIPEFFKGPYRYLNYVTATCVAALVGEGIGGFVGIELLNENTVNTVKTILSTSFFAALVIKLIVGRAWELETKKKEVFSKETNKKLQK